MAHGLNAMLKRGPSGGTLGCKSDGKSGIGSRRIFAPQFKLQVLDSYRTDADCKGNQRATARKYGIHRRQIQKWLQVEGNLRNSVLKGVASSNNNNNNIVSGNSNNNNNMMMINNNNSSSSSGSVVTTTSGVSVSGELIVGPEAASSRKCGLAVALRSGAQSGRLQDDSSGRGAACATETDTAHQHGGGGEVRAALAVQQQPAAQSSGGEREVSSRVLADKRVPDTPPHNNNNNTIMYQPPPPPPHHLQQQQPPAAYEWQHYQMRRSPDTASSTSGSCYSDLGDTSPLHQLHHVPLVACGEGRCECAALLPLDYTVHARTHGASQRGAGAAAHSPRPARMSSPVPRALSSSSSSPPPPPVSPALPVPMDLSVRRRRAIHAPVPVIAAVPPAPRTTPPPPASPPSSAPPHIWDLSTAGRDSGVKRPYDDQDTSAAAAAARSLQQPRPVKLFKPYLDHVFDEEAAAPPGLAEEDEECDVKPSGTGHPPVIVSASNYDTEYFYNNNNNGDYKMMEYTVLYKEEETSSSCGGGGAPYYCPLSEYYPSSGGVPYVSASGGQEMITVHHHHHSSSSSSSSPFMFGTGASSNNSSTSVHSIKQRQSYSLDFKLSAIECYYRDAVCRGNQRAVASKYRIHRRQVQKWLKQEDQLRQRHETVKPMHIVR